MTVFDSHVNWATLLVVAAGHVAIIVLILLFSSQPQALFVPSFIALTVVYLVSASLVSRWMLRKKGQSQWYALLLLLPILDSFVIPSVLFTFIASAVYMALSNKYHAIQRELQKCSARG
jgi:hypothetical protein